MTSDNRELKLPVLFKFNDFPAPSQPLHCDVPVLETIPLIFILSALAFIFSFQVAASGPIGVSPHLAATLGAAVIGGAFWWLMPLFAKVQSAKVHRQPLRGGIAIGTAIAAVPAAVLFFVVSPGAVLPGHDPIIVPSSGSSPPQPCDDHGGLPARRPRFHISAGLPDPLFACRPYRFTARQSGHIQGLDRRSPCPDTGRLGLDGIRIFRIGLPYPCPAAARLRRGFWTGKDGELLASAWQECSDACGSALSGPRRPSADVIPPYRRPAFRRGRADRRHTGALLDPVSGGHVLLRVVHRSFSARTGGVGGGASACGERRRCRSPCSPLSCRKPSTTHAPAGSEFRRWATVSCGWPRSS